MSKRPHILLATLGGQPQIVTFTLDLLLKDFPISHVIVMHPGANSEKMQRSLRQLQAEFVGDIYQATGQTIHYRPHVIKMDDEPIGDIIDDEHADATLETIHQLIADLKRQRYHIHISITGGRRMMGMLAACVAAINFDRHDHIWHIYTPDETVAQVKDGARMHVSPEAGVRLIRGPFIALGAYIAPGQTSFKTAEQEQQEQIDQQERRRCQSVVDLITPGQLKVLKAFARGLRTSQIARQLSISEATVHSHKHTLFQHCRTIWDLPASDSIDYHFFYQKFGTYFEDNYKS
ncbi:CRISPR-associated ring nuclease [Tengunoibacter tsumagoiensis]|uniref:Histidine kinase n=1 Tax=Tengunoibacter tsumagoiensis TaxID=2014871 RepID=A0A402A9I8_9CHLR|nr:CRISPR-associated ring nuclease [Tengunoibacter tsumagoiensis]GCE15837.1 histidine kinase [Tengunoibacter tsumagoiensis]